MPASASDHGPSVRSASTPTARIKELGMDPLIMIGTRLAASAVEACRLRPGLFYFSSPFSFSPFVLFDIYLVLILLLPLQ